MEPTSFALRAARSGRDAVPSPPARQLFKVVLSAALAYLADALLAFTARRLTAWRTA